MTEPTTATSKLETTACGCGEGCGCCAAPARAVDFAGNAARARRLAWVSLVWMAGEGALGLTAGFQAGSAALLGWALGSVIEGLASVIVIWRFTGRRTHSATAEDAARKAVAVSFWLLAAYIAVQAVADLANQRHPDATTLGMVVTASSIVVMPALGVMKRRLGARLDSRATSGEGTQNYLCAAQAAAVLVALAAVAIAPSLWWLDAVAALLIASWSVYEGRTSWRGDDCC